MNINKCIIAGRITKELELKSVSNGSNVLRFSIANNVKAKDKEINTFINCTAWGKTAEIICKFFEKGQEILIIGKFTNNNYKDAEGHMHYNNEIWVEEFQFVGYKKNSNDQMEISDADDSDLPF